MWKHGKLWEGVPFETAEPPFTSEKRANAFALERRNRTAPAFSTIERPSPWNRMRKRCVSCVPSSGVELRTAVPRRVALAYPRQSPKDTLKGVFERLKRTARTKKFARMSERLAPRDPLVQRPRQEEFAFPLRAAADLACPGRRVRVSEVDALRRDELAFVAGCCWRRTCGNERRPPRRG